MDPSWWGRTGDSASCTSTRPTAASSSMCWDSSTRTAQTTPHRDSDESARVELVRRCPTSSRCAAAESDRASVTDQPGRAGARGRRCAERRPSPGAPARSARSTGISRTGAWLPRVVVGRRDAPQVEPLGDGRVHWACCQPTPAAGRSTGSRCRGDVRQASRVRTWMLSSRPSRSAPAGSSTLAAEARVAHRHGRPGPGSCERRHEDGPQPVAAAASIASSGPGALSTSMPTASMSPSSRGRGRGPPGGRPCRPEEA